MTRELLGLGLLGLAVHAAWALTIPVPIDWDARYYSLVAERIVAGEGATTGSLWTLSYLPEQLPVPADLHWMPLPSRVLLPGVWLWPEGGGQLVNVLLAALWGPLTCLLARHHGLDTRQAVGAGVLASTGGLWARLLSTTDVYALYGVIGALAFLALAKRRLAVLAVLAVLAALTRNDGFLLGICLGAGLLGRDRGSWARSATVAGSGVAAYVAWSLRAVWVGGPGVAEARLAAASVPDYVAFYDGTGPPIGVGERLLLAAAETPSVLEAWFMPGLLVFTPLAGWAAWQHRDRPWVRAAVLYAVVVPVVVVLLAPVLGGHGALGRSAPAIVAPTLVLGVQGLAALSAWGARARGYPRAFLPGMLGGTFVVISLGLGVRYWLDAPSEPIDCGAVERAGVTGPVFSSNPLAYEQDCGLPGVMLTDRVTPQRVEALADRFHVRAVVVSDGSDEGSLREADIARVMPDWIARGDGVWTRP